MALVRTSSGAWLNEDAAASYELMNAAFRARFGRNLYITSGARTYQQQVEIFTTNNTTKPTRWSDGRYITRWWNGQIWYLKPGYATAAVPGTSNHEYPPGRAADFGSGVQTRGTAEHNWMIANAWQWGWVWTGKDFVTIEAWHWEKLRPTLAGGGAKPFEPGTSTTPEPPAPPTRKADDVPTFIKTQQHGHYSVAPGVAIGIADGLWIDSVVHVAAQTTGGPLPLVLNVTSDDLAEWLFYLSGCPSNAIPAPGYAWFASNYYEDADVVLRDKETVLADIAAAVREKFRTTPLG